MGGVCILVGQKICESAIHLDRQYVFIIAFLHIFHHSWVIWHTVRRACFQKYPCVLILCCPCENIMYVWDNIIPIFPGHLSAYYPFFWHAYHWMSSWNTPFFWNYISMRRSVFLVFVFFNILFSAILNETEIGSSSILGSGWEHVSLTCLRTNIFWGCY